MANKNEIKTHLDNISTGETEVQKVFTDIRNKLTTTINSESSSSKVDKVAEIESEIRKLEAMLEGLRNLKEVNDGIGLQIADLQSQKDTIKLAELKPKAVLINKALDGVEYGRKEIRLEFEKIYNKEGVIKSLLEEANLNMENSDQSMGSAETAIHTLGAILQTIKAKKSEIERTINLMDSTNDVNVVNNVDTDITKQEISDIEADYTAKKEVALTEITGAKDSNKESKLNLEDVGRELETLEVDATNDVLTRAKIEAATDIAGFLDRATLNQSRIEEIEELAKNNPEYSKEMNELKDLHQAMEVAKINAVDRIDSNITADETKRINQVEKLLKKTEGFLSEAEKTQTNYNTSSTSIESKIAKIQGVIDGKEIDEADTTTYDEVQEATDINDEKTGIENAIKTIAELEKNATKALDEANNIPTIANTPGTYRENTAKKMEESKLAVGILLTKITEISNQVNSDYNYKSLVTNFDSAVAGVNPIIEEFLRKRAEKEQIFARFGDTTQRQKEEEDNFGQFIDQFQETLNNKNIDLKLEKRKVNQVDTNEILADKTLFLDLKVIDSSDLNEVISKVERYEGADGTSSAKIDFDNPIYTKLKLNPVNEGDKQLIILLEVVNNLKMGGFPVRVETGLINLLDFLDETKKHGPPAPATNSLRRNLENLGMEKLANSIKKAQESYDN